MAIVLKMYTPGDAAVWPLIGPFLTSREVHKSLGGPVVSEPEETTWWVATKGKAVVGFCALRDAKDAYWLENSYVIPEERGDGLHTQLSDARLKYLKTLPPKTVKVCCRMARWHYYVQQGFVQDRVKGDWVYASRLSAPTKEKE